MGTEPTVGPLQQGLFRPESLRARELSWLGRPALALDLSATFTSIAAVALAAAAAALIIFGAYTRRVELQGAVLPDTGLVAISAPEYGQVVSLAVHEGDKVERNALLYTLNLDTATKDGATQQQITNALTAQRRTLDQQIESRRRIGSAKDAALRRQLANLRAQDEQFLRQITLQQKFVQRMYDDFTTLQPLARSHDVSRKELSAREQIWMQAQTGLQQLRDSELRVQGEIGDAQFALDTNDITTRNDVDTLRTKINDVDQSLARSEARRGIEIRAPAAGVVTAILARRGQVIAQGTPMLSIVPQHDRMQAQLLAPSSAIGFVHPGARVLLRYSGFPYQKYGQHHGRVIDVSHVALRQAEVQDLLAGASPSRQAGSWYRITVQPDHDHVMVDGQEQALPAGMQVQASVLLDRRPLYQWIVEPLYGVARAARGQ
jgi:membrane fusion protein